MPWGTTFFARPVHNCRIFLQLPNGEGFVCTDLMFRLRDLEKNEVDEDVFDYALFPMYLKHPRMTMGSGTRKWMSEVSVEPAAEGGPKFLWCPETYKSEGDYTLRMDFRDGPAYLT